MLITPLVLLVAFSSPAAPFDDAKAKAGQVKSLKLALKALAEPCDLYDVGGHECQERQKEVQKKLRKKRHYLYLGISEQGLHIKSIRGTKAKLSWTPFVDGGGNVALTVGKPLRLSKSGGPVMRLKTLNATLADGIFDSDLERAVRLGQVAVEVVGTFGKVWEKNHKGKKVRGVLFKPTHLRLSNSRNGKPLADVQF